MSTSDDVREFLISRRAQLTPEQAGLPAGYGQRRVPGLRREEVAILAGVSVDYYTKLERGKIRNASQSVLDAIADALQLNDVERAHLHDVARATGRPAAERPAPPSTVRPSLTRMLESMTVPAIVYNRHQDLVAANVLGRAMFCQHFEAERPNLARYVFLDSRAQTFFDDWELACSLTAAMLRFEAGRNPLDAALTELVGELSTRSPQFRNHWAQRDVHEHRTGEKTFHHPQVGTLVATYDVLELPGEPDLSITTYTAEASSATTEKFTLLASWAAGAASPDAGASRRAEPSVRRAPAD
ncbi:helix-turn-helix transcriptional regulator [Zhihengliuella flava]|uniref:Transcriptional regulator with XRE-family HTH domain n=1 Tax=Zhihengliuella flava TaxID=1285193 RepID=A0A931D8M3_9MICC|nr:helix-turn-helix transcriptional regulator [Zhihengliuella flava]MBG6084442.1 transcriptional regulator with XRE-family HTH domain [Zhihengliuella flava]